MSSSNDATGGSDGGGVPTPAPMVTMPPPPAVQDTMPSAVAGLEGAAAAAVVPLSPTRVQIPPPPPMGGVISGGPPSSSPAASAVGSPTVVKVPPKPMAATMTASSPTNRFNPDAEHAHRVPLPPPPTFHMPPSSSARAGTTATAGVTAAVRTATSTLPPPPTMSTSSAAPPRYGNVTGLPPPPLPPQPAAAMAAGVGVVPGYGSTAHNKDLAGGGEQPTIVAADGPPPIANIVTTPSDSSSSSPAVVPADDVTKGIPPPPPSVPRTTAGTTGAPPPQPTHPYQYMVLNKLEAVENIRFSLSSSSLSSSSSKQKYQNNGGGLVLAKRHSHVPILILPTSLSTYHLATQNHLDSLTELFQQVCDSGQVGKHSVPPFRSINRTIYYDSGSSGGMMGVNFVDSPTMDIWSKVKNAGLGAAGDKTTEDLLMESARGIGTESELDGGGGGSHHSLKMEEITDILQQLHNQYRGDGSTSSFAGGIDGDERRGSLVDNDTHGNLEEVMEVPVHEHRQPERELDRELILSLTSSPTTPWMRRYRQVLDATTDYLPCEMAHCPVCILLVACTSDENYVMALRELTSVHHLPRAYGLGQFDLGDVQAGHGGAKRFLVLLHDESSNPNFDDKRAMGELRREFPGYECTVLRLNTNPAPPSGQVVGKYLSEKDITTLRTFVANTVMKDGIIPTMERRIIHLNAVVSNAKKGVKNMFNKFLRKPKEAMGGSLHGLSMPSVGGGSSHGSSSQHGGYEVTAGGTVVPGSPGAGHGEDATAAAAAEDSTYAVRYRFDSIESQTRLLADSLFLMKDYESALSFYKLVKDDYKSDKALVYYANIQEMISLCLYQLDGNGTMNVPSGDMVSTGYSRYGREIAQSIENALYSYTRAADEERSGQQASGAGAEQASRPNRALVATRLATRLCLVVSGASFGSGSGGTGGNMDGTWSSPSYIGDNRQLEIADLLASASSHETPMGAAVLLEQASGHYWKANLLRKYGFHMLMSGHMYRSCKQERHGMRCFAAALHVYQAANWRELFDHLQSALAQQLYALPPDVQQSNMCYTSMALQFYCRLVGSGTGRISARSQHKFVQHFMEICRTKPEQAMIAAGQMRLATKAMEAELTSSSGSDQLGHGVLSVEDDNGFVEVLEIPNMDLPRIADSTVAMHSASSASGMKPSSEIGRTVGADGLLLDTDAGEEGWSDTPGLESGWTELSSSMDAELQASIPAPKPLSDDEEFVPASDTIDRVLFEMDKADRLAQTSKRGKSSRLTHSSPTSRPRMEPFTVSVTMANPLGIVLPLSEVQLIAVLSSNEVGKPGTCTNVKPLVGKASGSIDGNPAKKRQWRFESSARVFEWPTFARVVSNRGHFAGVEDEPYFVVDKQAFTMEPGSVQTLDLSLCPLAKGDLVVRGIRFKLFDEVWVCHHFQLQGPLLQDTRVHRANRVRGQNLLLHSKVEGNMPLLDVQVMNVNECTLQGELNHWTIHITNKGSAPASDLYLKTNLPWICLDSDTSNEGISPSHGESEPTSSAVGPSGTLVKLPLKETAGKSVTPILSPGQTIEVPIRVRAAGGGKQELHMLFRYDSAEKEKDAAADISTRCLRKIVAVSVYPSLTFTASLMPSYWHKHEHILSVELTNYRSDRQSDLAIDVEKVCIASRFYRVVELGGQVAKVAETSSWNLSIGWQERVTLHFIVVPLDYGAFTLTEMGNKGQTPSGKGLMCFPCLEDAFGKLTLAVRQHKEEQARLAALQEEQQQQPRSISQIRRQNTRGPRSMNDVEDNLSMHPTSIGSLCPLDESHSTINVMCIWRAKSCHGSSVCGQHHLLQLPVRPKVKNHGCPLTITAQHKTNVTHNFSEGPVDMDMEITVRNRLVSPSGQSTKEGEHQDDDLLVKFEFAVNHQPDFEFAGARSFDWELEGGEEVTIPLKATFAAPGVYNLQSVQLTISEGTEKVPYLFPLQWLVQVNDTRS